MSNHWHFVVWPERDGDLPAFLQQVTNTHVKRWKEHGHEIGYGHLYQGHYKCFPVETEDYFYQVVRYVERNALRKSGVEIRCQWKSGVSSGNPVSAVEIRCQCIFTARMDGPTPDYAHGSSVSP